MTSVGQAKRRRKRSRSGLVCCTKPSLDQSALTPEAGYYKEGSMLRKSNGQPSSCIGCELVSQGS